jgi:uncharacterized protein YaaQ
MANVNGNVNGGTNASSNNSYNPAINHPATAFTNAGTNAGTNREVEYNPQQLLTDLGNTKLSHEERIDRARKFFIGDADTKLAALTRASSTNSNDIDASDSFNNDANTSDRHIMTAIAKLDKKMEMQRTELAGLLVYLKEYLTKYIMVLDQRNMEKLLTYIESLMKTKEDIAEARETLEKETAALADQTPEEDAGVFTKITNAFGSIGSTIKSVGTGITNVVSSGASAANNILKTNIISPPTGSQSPPSNSTEISIAEYNNRPQLSMNNTPSATTNPSTDNTSNANPPNPNSIPANANQLNPNSIPANANQLNPNSIPANANPPNPNSIPANANQLNPNSIPANANQLNPNANQLNANSNLPNGIPPNGNGISVNGNGNPPNGNSPNGNGNLPNGSGNHGNGNSGNGNMVYSNPSAEKAIESLHSALAQEGGAHVRKSIKHAIKSLKRLMAPKHQKRRPQKTRKNRKK